MLDYSIFYNKKMFEDVLMIVFNNSAVPSRKEKMNDNIWFIYCGNELVGINIFNISNYIKIHANGLIPLPNKKFIDVLNSILKQVNFEALPYKENSGFIVGKIISCVEHEESNHLHILKVDIGSKVLDIVCGATNVKQDEIVVVATINTTMFDGSKIVKGNLLGVDSYGMCCSERELHLTSDQGKHELLLLDDTYKIGSDFFSY